MNSWTKIDSSWLQVLDSEFQKDYFKKIKQFLISDIEAGKVLYPPMPLLFNAFNTTPFGTVKVVILWQDPYHWPGQAHGLSFSVQDGVPFPPSLRNIFKELKDDMGGNIPTSGNLQKWSEQGILLLNASLSVRAGEPMSHAKIGWEVFTDAVIKTLSEKKEGLIFILWGNFARSKKVLIDTSKHFIIESAHPSPLGAHKWFFWSKPFSKTNEILKKLGKEEIIW